MNRDDQMKKYDNPEFWSKVIKEAKRQAAPVEVKHVYKPLGMWIVIGLLVLVTLMNSGVPVMVSLISTMLIILVAFVLS